MTKFKKTAALLLIIAVLLSLSVSVFAANAQTADNQPYTYDAETGTFTITAFSQMGMTKLSAGMFQGAEGMTREVVIEDEDITEIGEQAFLNCFRLEKVTIPATVTKISKSAFYGCSDSLVIYGEKGSAAAKFADKYGYSFKEVSSSGKKNIEGNIGTGIEVTILGIGVVFLILIILCLVLKLFEKIFANQSQPQKVQAPAPVSVPAPAAAAEDDTELVAVIAAAIAASLNTSTYNLKIKSVKRLGSSWNQAARVQNFNNNF